MWKRLVALAISAAVLVGCGSEKPKTPTEECNISCNHQSLSESGCAAGYIELFAHRIVDEDKMGALSGVVHLRRGVGRCENIYWATFTPDEHNKAHFSTSIKTSAQPDDTKSSGSLTQEVSTYGIHRELQVVIACVTLLDTKGKKVGTDTCTSPLIHTP